MKKLLSVILCLACAQANQKYFTQKLEGLKAIEAEWLVPLGNINLYNGEVLNKLQESAAKEFSYAFSGNTIKQFLETVVLSSTPQELGCEFVEMSTFRNRLSAKARFEDYQSQEESIKKLLNDAVVSGKDRQDTLIKMYMGNYHSTLLKLLQSKGAEQKQYNDFEKFYNELLEYKAERSKAYYHLVHTRPMMFVSIGISLRILILKSLQLEEAKNLDEYITRVQDVLDTYITLVKEQMGPESSQKFARNHLDFAYEVKYKYEGSDRLRAGLVYNALEEVIKRHFSAQERVRI